MTTSERVARMEEALKQIAEWKIPMVYDEVSRRHVAYGYLYGSNGERDMMRNIAHKALADD